MKGHHKSNIDCHIDPCRHKLHHLTTKQVFLVLNFKIIVHFKYVHNFCLFSVCFVLFFESRTILQPYIFWISLRNPYRLQIQKSSCPSLLHVVMKSKSAYAQNMFIVLNLVIQSHTIVKVSTWREVLYLFYNWESNLSQLL